MPDFRLLPMLLLLLSGLALPAQDEAAAPPPRGSVIEDRAARKLLDAGELRYEAGEVDKAVEIWGSLLERYPRSRVRFAAHLKLGEHFLAKERAFDRARSHFESAAAEANPDEPQRATATLKSGVCYYEARNYGRAFKVMRGVIENFPTSGEVNAAYYYIGLGHFKLGHYSRAIEALEKVGTALADDDLRIERVEAGRRLYIKVDDRDLATLEAGETVTATCKVTSGDQETVECLPVGREVRLALGSIPTALGRAVPGNGRLEVRGGDRIEVTYVDAHTADMKFNISRAKQVQIIGNGAVEIMDGSFNDTLGGVVIGKPAHLQLTDPDGDRGDGADRLRARVEILRAKSTAEVEDERVAELARRAAGTAEPAEGAEAEEPEIERYKLRDSLEIDLTEVKLTGKEQRFIRNDTVAPAAGEGELAPVAAAPAPAPAADDGTVHSGVFRGTVPIESSSSPVAGDNKLQAEPGDLLRITYLDEVNLTGEAREVKAEAKCVEGNLGDVRVTKADIADRELALRTKLKTASALTQIGNHYKEFGLADKAEIKYAEALDVAEDISEEARKLGGSILEQTYVQLWRIYFAMDRLNLALAMSSRLQAEFPNSEFVDEAILQQAHVARKRGDLARAINLYGNLAKLKVSPLKGEGQFGVAECYEEMAKAAPAEASEQLYERAFLAYQKVYEQFPDSGRVGDAVAKMANFYYQKKDYARAIDVFENVLTDHPDANFLDVILFNYGRCLYRLDRKIQAAEKFDHLIDDFPESPLAAEAKKISEALSKVLP